MTSQEAWNYYESLVDKPMNGNVIPSVFATLFNNEQITYMDALIGSMKDFRPGQSVSRNSSEAAGRSMDAVTPFWKTRFAIPVSNGIATLDQGDYMGMPLLFLPGYENPACGEPSPVRYEIPLERIPASEWPARTNPLRYNHPTIENPAFQTIESGKVMVSPYESIRSLWATYIRKPAKITIAMLPNSDPDPNAVNANPEWNDIDTIAIINCIVGLVGIREAVSRWIQFPQLKGMQP